MLEKSSLRKRCLILVLLVFGLLLDAAWAQKENVLYSFCKKTNCVDGANPSAGLVFDQEGNMYGTTVNGGAYNSTDCYQNFAIGCGVVFKLDPAGKETVLHSFCAQANCADGANPYAGLIFDQKGNLYGTTEYGGTSSECNNGGCGVVFKLTPEGKETVLYSFCAHYEGGICTDGANPRAGLVFDREGNLYGTTYNGGVYNYNSCYYGCGVVFKLTPEGKETVLYTFCTQGGNPCTDGALPDVGLIFDQKGNLYGTTVGGGGCGYNGGCGLVFKLTPKRKEIVLYTFCAQSETCSDGAWPYARLILDREGNLYGTTWAGGLWGCSDDFGCGAVFKLTPEGKETVLYNFCALTNCIDGERPYAGLIFDQKGNLYGATYNGGAPRGGGVVFRLTPEGEETPLYSLCWDINCADGAAPLAGLVFDQKGNLYGTTSSGGVYDECRGQVAGCGVVFELTP